MIQIFYRRYSMSVSSGVATSFSLGILLDVQKEQRSNSPYAYGISLPVGGVVRRISYLGAVIGSVIESIVSFANLIFSLFNAALCLFKDPEKNGICRHYFAHVDLSLSSLYIGLVGILLPHAADALAGNFFKQIKFSQSVFSKIWFACAHIFGSSPNSMEYFARDQLDRIDRFAEK